MSRPEWKDPEVIPFLNRGRDWTDRDRERFALGFQFGQISEHLALRPRRPLETTVFRANETRLRVLCSRHSRRCTFETLNAEQSVLRVEPA